MEHDTKESLLSKDERNSSKNKSFVEEMELTSAFVDFRDANKAFWYVLNFTTLLIAGGFIYGTYYILDWNITDCGGIRLVLWCNIILHTINIMVTLINLSGFETKIFNCNMVCGFSLFQSGIFLFMQFVYFEAQGNKCMTAAPEIYFWLMF